MMSLQVHLHLVMPQFQMYRNEYIAYYYDNDWWIALIQEINGEVWDVEINSMHPPGPSTGVECIHQGIQEGCNNIH